MEDPNELSANSLRHSEELKYGKKPKPPRPIR